EPMDWNHVRAHVARDTALLAVGSGQWAMGSEQLEKSRIEDGTPFSTDPSLLPTAHCPLPTEEAPTAHCPLPTEEAPTAHCPLLTEEAARLAGLRVFGSKPGAYGAGLLPLMDSRDWQSIDDLADVY